MYFFTIKSIIAIDTKKDRKVKIIVWVIGKQDNGHRGVDRREKQGKEKEKKCRGEK